LVGYGLEIHISKSRHSHSVEIGPVAHCMSSRPPPPPTPHKTLGPRRRGRRHILWEPHITLLLVSLRYPWHHPGLAAIQASARRTRQSDTTTSWPKTLPFLYSFGSWRCARCAQHECAEYVQISILMRNIAVIRHSEQQNPRYLSA
jgi:hypothetical protein